MKFYHIIRFVPLLRRHSTSVYSIYSFVVIYRFCHGQLNLIDIIASVILSAREWHTIDINMEWNFLPFRVGKCGKITP